MLGSDQVAESPPSPLFPGSVLKAKLLKIVSHFGARTYNYPETRNGRIASQVGLRVELEDLSLVIRHTASQLRAQHASLASRLALWRRTISRELATLHALNQLTFNVHRAVFAAEGWVPTARVGALSAALAASAARGGRETRPIVNLLESKETPPTSLPINKFTRGFQGLVNTYGTPRYREVNPGAFAIILFPFLFAIMFGDVGHGALLTLLALEAGFRNFFASALANNQRGFAKAVQQSTVPRSDCFICGSVVSNRAQDEETAYKLTKLGCAENTEAFAYAAERARTLDWMRLQAELLLTRPPLARPGHTGRAASTCST